MPLKFSMRTVVVLGFAVSVVALVGAGALSYRTTARLIAIQEWVDHSREVIGTREEGLANLTEAETAQRGFLLTGNEQFQKDCLEAASHVDRWLERLRALTSDEPDQQARLDELEALVTQRVALMNSRMKLRREQGLQAVVESVAARSGKDLMDQIRARIAEMHTAENRVLGERQLAAQARARVSERTILIGCGLACLVGIVALLVFRHDLKSRE